MNSFQKEKHVTLIYALFDKAFKGTVVNPAFPSLPGVSLEVTLTVPISEFDN